MSFGFKPRLAQLIWISCNLGVPNMITVTLLHVGYRVFAIVWAAVFLLYCFFCILGIRQRTPCKVWQYCKSGGRTNAIEEHLIQQDDVGMMLLVCGFIKMLLVPIGFVCGSASTAVFGSASPSMALLPFVAYIAKSREASACAKSMKELVISDFTEWTSFPPSFPFLASIPTIISEFQHGLLMATAFAEDTSIYPTFIAGWCHAASPVACSITKSVHLYGALIITYLTSVIFHSGCMMLNVTLGPEGLVRIAKIVGFGVLSKKLEEEDDIDELRRNKIILSTTLPISFFSVLPFMLWQTSLAMAEAHHSLTTAASVVLSSTIGLQQVFSTGKAMIHVIMYDQTIGKVLTLVVFGSLWIVCFFLTLLMAVRGLMAYVCRGEWGLASGCLAGPY